VEEFIRGFARVVTPTHTLDVIKEDPADDRILECAVEAGSEYLVSRDKDLHRLGSTGVSASSSLRICSMWPNAILN
jgi:predicted nucleic acid-binding protein